MILSMCYRLVINNCFLLPVGSENVAIYKQVEALKTLHEADPSGRFWVKLDATDVKIGLLVSTKGIWSGDSDLASDTLSTLKEEHRLREDLVNQLCVTKDACVLEELMKNTVQNLEGDIALLKVSSGLGYDIKVFSLIYFFYLILIAHYGIQLCHVNAVSVYPADSQSARNHWERLQ